LTYSLVLCNSYFTFAGKPAGFSWWGSCEYNILSILFVWGELYGLAFFRMDVSISRHGLEGEWVFLRHGVPYGSMSSNQIWDKPIGETDTAPTSKPKA